MTPDAREIAERLAVQLIQHTTSRHNVSLIEAALLSHGDAKIEEAAKVAERFGFPGQHDFPKIIADEIRALKSAPVNPAEQETERE